MANVKKNIKYYNNFNMQFENKIFGIQGYLILNYYYFIHFYTVNLFDIALYLYYIGFELKS